MKKFILYIILAATILIATEKTIAQNANTSLSNLVKTKINQNLDPKTANTFNLGSSDSGWKSLYLTGNIFLDKQRFISNAGSGNNFFGTNAGKANTSGANNTATGVYALYSNTSGTSNTATGNGALSYNTTGDYNTSSGFYALGYSIAGNYNTANGFYALLNNTNSYNTATGAFALYKNNSGYDNTAIGTSALYYNTTGTSNTATGLNALTSNSTGIDNTATGTDALNENNGSYNTGVGTSALFNTTASEFNTAVGYNAGFSYDNGWNNVFIGANVDVNGTGYYNDIAIGQGTICTDVSQVTIGNGATTSYRAYANWSNISDGRFKKNIKQNVPGLVFINKLQPVTYTLDATGLDNFLHKDLAQSKQTNDASKAAMAKALQEKEKTLYTGFVAQDVEKAAKSLNYDFSGVDAAKNDKDVYGLRYSDFVVPLVKAVQELSKMNDAKDSAIQQQNAKIDNLQKQINDLKNIIINHSGISSQQSVDDSRLSTISSASVSQNIPNPFSNTTTINYSLPQTYSSAKIIITDNKGVALKQINLNTKGKGNVNIDASTLAAGAYQYSLYVDGKLINTKQMISAK